MIKTFEEYKPILSEKEFIDNVNSVEGVYEILDKYQYFINILYDNLDSSLNTPIVFWIDFSGHDNIKDILHPQYKGINLELNFKKSEISKWYYKNGGQIDYLIDITKDTSFTSNYKKEFNKLIIKLISENKDILLKKVSTYDDEQDFVYGNLFFEYLKNKYTTLWNQLDENTKDMIEWGLV